MESNELSRHAAVRMQQRGISGMALECLLACGQRAHDHRGAEVLYFDRRARQRCLREFGPDVVRRIEAQFDVYAVIGRDGLLATVGHRHRRIPH